MSQLLLYLMGDLYGDIDNDASRGFQLSLAYCAYVRKSSGISKMRLIRFKSLPYGVGCTSVLIPVTFYL